jgi:TMEM175 potassium channel family protein
VLYIGCLAASSVFLAVLAVTVRRDPTVRDPDTLPEVRPAVVTAGLLLLALVVAVAVPATSYYPLLLLLAGDGVNGIWQKLAERRDPERRARPTSRSRSA